MNEEIEYAEMLEIPVSTVNVIKKKRRGGGAKADLKEALIKEVNERVERAAEPSAPSVPSAQAAAPARLYRIENKSEQPLTAKADERKDAEESAEKSEPSKNSAPSKNSDIADKKPTQEPTADRAAKAATATAATAATAATTATAAKSGAGQRIDTLSVRGERGAFFENAALDNGENYLFKNEGEEEIWGRYATNAKTAERPTPADDERKRTGRGVGILLTTEFAVSCALCGLIFLTNVMMPESGINTFFKNLSKEQAAVDTRTYADFELSGVVSELSDAKLTVSPSGVLTFTDACCVYPAVDGKVEAVEKNADGTYEVTIAHNAKFCGVISGLDYVYYGVGEQVYSNIPVGYTAGNTAVSVTMYADGEILTAYTVDDENTLVWAEE